MEPSRQNWNVFDPAAPILTCSYSFGPGVANALAARCEGGLIVVSPPPRIADNVFEDLQRYGPVRALVAPNAFHHMGIPAWKRRFPDAAVFAPAQSIARVERKTGLHGIRPLAEAAAIAGPRLQLTDMPHYRTGEALVRTSTDRGLVWYVTDVIMNMPALPAHPVAKMLFKLSGSAPGLKYNNIASLFMVKNTKALKRWLAAEYQKAPPRWLIAAHGDVADFGANPQSGRKLFLGA